MCPSSPSSSSEECEEEEKKDFADCGNDQDLAAASTASGPWHNHIPQQGRIRILYQDEEIVVVDKPPYLRSVPGHADKHSDGNNDNGAQQPSESTQGQSPLYDKITSQQAWKRAILELAAEHAPAAAEKKNQQEAKNGNDHLLPSTLAHLGASQSRVESIPRRFSPFCRYMARNARRLQLNATDGSKNRVAAQEVFNVIKARQRAILDATLPPSTPLQDSVVGQLLLQWGHGDDGCLHSAQPPLFVVHRLDCATSGVLVLARTPTAASYLSRVWRRNRLLEKSPNDDDQSSVQKLYTAEVVDWPLYTRDGRTEGRIDLALAPSKQHVEDISWKVDASGKPSTTLWKVIGEEKQSRTGKSSSIRLQLQPITGRTHQLRVHVAALNGSGIVGDDLYGKPAKGGLDSSSPLPPQRRQLHLHAHQLSFPHPRTGQRVTFSSPVPW